MTILFIILAATVARAPTAIENWRPPRWNMTIAEVAAAVPDAQTASPHDEEFGTNPLAKVRLRKSTKFLGETFTAYYEFAPQKAFGASVDRLVRISLLLAPYDGRKTSRIIQRLTENYGAPINDFAEPGVHHVIWANHGDQIWLSEMTLESYVSHAPLLNIAFMPEPRE